MSRTAAPIYDERTDEVPDSAGTDAGCEVGGDVDEAIRFLGWLSSDGPWLLASINPDSRKVEGRTFSSSELDELRKWIEQRNGKSNLYFSVNEVRSGFRGPKASRKDVARVRQLHVDIDPRPGADLASEQARILALLTDSLPNDVPKPSGIVYSGGGYQAFWRLEEAMGVDGNLGAADVAESLNRWLEDRLGGDKCHNIDRIMRLPGTINVPDARKRSKGRVAVPARLVECNDTAYPVSVFRRAEQEAKSAGDRHGSGPGGSGSRIDLDALNLPDRLNEIILKGRLPDEPKPGDNSRSAWLFDAVCGLIRQKVADDVIVGIITNPEYGISESVLEKGERAYRAYAVKQVHSAHQKIAEGENPDLGRMNARCAVIRDYGGRTRVMRLRDTAAPVFQSVDDFRNGHLNEFTDIPGANGAPTRVNIAKWWLTHPSCRKYERVEFLPGSEPDDSVYNLWQGWAADPREGVCTEFLAFLRDIICRGNTTHYEWLLNWMAHAVQHPQVQAEVAVALRGGQGIGKSYFAEHFGELYKGHFVPLTDPKHIVGNFNMLLHTAGLVFADEVFAVNDKRVEGVLKGLITQRHITIEPKGVDAFKAKRYFRLILASNHDWMVPADLDDRRFLVLDVNAIHKNDHEYFARLEVEWTSGGREALMHLLLQRDISGFNHRERPETAALVDQKALSLRGAQRLVYELLCSGDPPVLKAEKGRVFVATRELLNAKRDLHVSETALGRELATIAVNKTSARATVDGKQRRGFWLPPLRQARDHWSAAIGFDPPWPDDDGEWAGE